MKNAAVLINPRAAQQGSKGLALAEALKSRGLESRMTLLKDFDALSSYLERFVRDGVECLFISSGDGTVQAIQTWLAENKSLRTLPQLCLLPHGSTNLTAGDVGYKNKTISAQVDFIERGTPKDIIQRSSLRVVNPADAPPQHGMFFGTGAIAEATLYCQRVFNERGVRGNRATLSTLAAAIGKSILTRPNPHDLARLDRPHPITLTTAGKTLCQGQQLLMLATTLDKLLWNSKPFWGEAPLPLRTTVIPYPRPNPIRWALPLLFGGPHRNVPQGAISQTVSSCDVSCPTSFVIDGQFFQPPKQGPLKLETGPIFHFVVA